MSFAQFAGKSETLLEAVMFSFNRLLTSLETSIKTLNSYCAEMNRLVTSNASLSRIEGQKMVMQEEEANVRKLILELYALKKRVRERDHMEFESYLQPIHRQYQLVADEFMRTCKLVDEVCHSASAKRALHKPARDHMFVDHGREQEQMQLLHRASQEGEYESAMDDLEQAIVETSECFKEVLLALEEQSGKLDIIENNFAEAEKMTTKGTRDIQAAHKYSLGSIPLAGALIGGAIGGPLGVLVGAKVGAVGALVGVTIGGTVGQWIRSRKAKAIEQEADDFETSVATRKTR